MPQSTPNEDATIYDSTIEGSMQVAKYAAPAFGLLVKQQQGPRMLNFRRGWKGL